MHRVDPAPETRHTSVIANYCIGGGKGGSLTAGIALLGVRESTVIRNRVEQSTRESILIHDYTPDSGNVVKGNILRVSDAGEALVLQESPGTLVSGNHIRP